MSHSYTMESESLHPESAPMTPLPALAPPSSSSPHSATAVPAPVPLHPQPVPRVKSTKPHVPSACINCKKAHLACDLSRPCKRCISVGKDDTCRDVEHKKRGRPKLVDKLVAVDGVWSTAAKDGSVAASKAVSSTTTAAALAKTRVKGKYTKSTNYKMPRKTTNGAKAPTEAFAVPQTNTPSRDIVLDAPQGRPSSYPSHHEQERPSSSMSYRTHPPSAQSYQGRPLSMHSEPPLPGDHQDPFYYPSPTSQIKRPQELYSGPSSTPLATVFLTMGLICARVSDESQVLWGYHPHDISNKPLYSIIANEDQSKMRNLMGLIRDAVFSAASPNGQHLSHFPFLESTSAVFYQNRPDIMSSSAPGSNEYTDVIRVCRADGGSELFSVRMYVGGGLGTDLVRGLNIEHAYVVCIMAHHAPPVMNDHPRNNQRLSLDDSRTASHNNAHGSNLAESQYNTMRQPLSQPQLSPLESRNA
ncbi:hypothetical protein BC939DRAFT_27238 [Gamsiella multidivaricata]|uniref:uncharacterized protein n=1 Tax=Gamsiella multidivaricata TaxID=101098 RepID=UPI0022206B1A|nr:uncharacterized protein BC939DRAFT_27238 [Gamsiella multidivaricata]KAI7829457.1 hypothetical protein BC939DRAFT_27238 [Gamsiella multidivaricata]